MIKKIRKAVIQIAFFVYNRIFSMFVPLEEDKVMFATEARKSLEGNLKVVYDKLPLKYKKVVHCVADRRNVKTMKEEFSRWKDLATSKYIFLDDFYGLISAMKVRKGQEIIQLWHGGGAYKKFGFSRVGTGDNIISVHKGYRKYTKVTVTAEDIRWCYAEAFDISIDKVKATGSPRTDIFFEEAEKSAAVQKVYEKFPELKDKKIVLIAPTYRGRKVESATYDFEALGINEIVKALGEEYKIVLKWHPALNNNIKKGLCDTSDFSYEKWKPEEVIDASDYEGISDLLIAADILVTDYSSVIFDWYLLNKPVVFFTYDVEVYTENRGLYFDFQEYIYGDVAKNYNELINSIKNGNLHDEERKVFGKKFMGACDGNSTKRVINWVFKGESGDD
jgi:CDP-ribitol ribitolphosphotransferase